MTSPLPLVSVLLPVHNAVPYLDECLDSLARQTLEDFEVVAVDDGSADGSAALLDRWAEKDPRIRAVHRKRQGLVATLNCGLALCRGSAVARMDADDLADPERLELQFEALREDPDLDVVSCLVSHFPRQTLGDGFRIYEEWLNGLVEHEEILRERFIESPLPHPSVMLRKQHLVEVGGYRDRGWPEDYDLWLRLASGGARFRKVEKVLLRWREHEKRLTRTDRRYAVERFLECKAHHLVEGPLRNGRPVLLWGAGQTGRRLSKHLKRFGAHVTAFIDIDPSKIARTLRGIPIHPPDDLDRLLQRDGKNVVLASVSSRGARALIRQHLRERSLVEGDNFWCVA